LAISDDYLKYPKRRYGMDHGRYDWSILPKRKPVEWPGKARIALWITVALEWFPLDQQGKPFKALGSLQTAYPDLRHYTLRDYGNRVGIFRVMKALEKRGIRASAAVNAAVAVRYPYLMEKLAQKKWEVIGHGLDMDHLHYEGMSGEKELIAKCVSAFKARGWMSPARSESSQTPDLLAEAGVEYLCDWINDDMPYVFKTKTRDLVAMPLSGDIDDAALLLGMHHDEDEFRSQVTDQFDLLYEEAGKHGGRIMSLTLHPWAIGQPYRIGALEGALDHILRHPGVWPATGGEILDAWRQSARA